MSWREKSQFTDLFFCTNVECNVITFRSGHLGRNVCPKCFDTGSLVRRADVIKRTSVFDKEKPKGESE